ncbi:MAG TPA: hypothetical protein VE988_27570 [Gemmataceae bacterium]|nr:hypothetical protein [Gemmataceae bacterium]
MKAMSNASCTPEGVPHRCPVCGKTPTVDPSSFPTPDAPCPHCGSLLWFTNRPGLAKEARLEVVRLAAEIGRLSEENLDQTTYYGEFLQRLLVAMAAPAGAIWVLTDDGQLMLEYQINMRAALVSPQNVKDQQSHDELLREVLAKAQPCMVPPNSFLGTPDPKQIAPGNHTVFLVLFAPIVCNKEVAGIIEVWQDPKRPVDAYRGFLQFMVKMAGYAAGFVGNAKTDGK